MDIRIFAHSWLSDWNHGNAHFLRGLASALLQRGHRVLGYESLAGGEGGWSLRQLRLEPNGAAAILQARKAYPGLEVRFYGAGKAPAPAEIAAWGGHVVETWEEELRGAEWVLVHEWNPPELFALLCRLRRHLGFRILLHDTHHRALTQPEVLRRLPLRGLDGVLAFGESLRQIYERWGVRHSYTLHEAADVERFHPAAEPKNGQGVEWDVAWIGNWGDEERTREIGEFLLEPSRLHPRLRAAAFGVRYPDEARQRLRGAGVVYRGYLPNLSVPEVYRRSRLALHIPRQAYGRSLPGIPTIRVFETLACGQPLLCAPWRDTEGLFRKDTDYWCARDGREMAARIKQLLGDEEQRMQLGREGAARIAARHTCAHRALELERICRDFD